MSRSQLFKAAARIVRPSYVAADISRTRDTATMYSATHHTIRTAVHNLVALRDARHALASHIGHASYAHMCARDRLAGTPDAVSTFLNSISGAVAPFAAAEAAELFDVAAVMKGAGPTTQAADVAARLRALPRRHADDVEANVAALRASGGAGIAPWDAAFLRRAILDARFSDAPQVPLVPLRAALRGLARVAKDVFGIEGMRAEDVEPMSLAEAWDVLAASPGGRKLHATPDCLLVPIYAVVCAPPHQCLQHRHVHLDLIAHCVSSSQLGGPCLRDERAAFTVEHDPQV